MTRVLTESEARSFEGALMLWIEASSRQWPASRASALETLARLVESHEELRRLAHSPDAASPDTQTPVGVPGKDITPTLMALMDSIPEKPL